jgi:hypothetical protein
METPPAPDSSAAMVAPDAGNAAVDAALPPPPRGSSNQPQRPNPKRKVKVGGGRGAGSGGGGGGRGRGGGVSGNGRSLNHTKSRQELKAELRKQVEFYLSRENLARDTYLTSMMDAQHTVPLEEIARFRKMIQICDDPELLKTLVPEAIAGSSVCCVTEDGKGLRPLIKSERNTLILRDISSDTKPARVREIFAVPDGKPVKSIRSDVGDTWFVTMESEADAVATMLAIRNQVITFQGGAIKARLKSEVSTFLGHGSSPRGKGRPHGGQQQPHHVAQNVSGMHGGFPMGAMPPPLGHPVPYMAPHMNGQGGYGSAYMGGGYPRHQRMPPQHSQRQMAPYAYAPGVGMRPLAATALRLNNEPRQGNARGINVRSEATQGKSHQKKNGQQPANYAAVKSSGPEPATTTAAGKKKKNKAKKDTAINGAADNAKVAGAGVVQSNTSMPTKDNRKKDAPDSAADEASRRASSLDNSAAPPSSILEMEDQSGAALVAASGTSSKEATFSKATRQAMPAGNGTEATAIKESRK